MPWSGAIFTLSERHKVGPPAEGTLKDQAKLEEQNTEEQEERCVVTELMEPDSSTEIMYGHMCVYKPQRSQ